MLAFDLISAATIAQYGAPGARIPGSDLYRSYCPRCNEPIRVRSERAALQRSIECSACHDLCRTERGRKRH